MYCTSGACDVNAICSEGNLQAICNCKTGFQGDGKTCTDIDECKIQSTCHKDANCNNFVGGHSCVCKPGYNGDGKSCKSMTFHLFKCIVRGLDFNLQLISPFSTSDVWPVMLSRKSQRLVKLLVVINLTSGPKWPKSIHL